MQAGQAFDVGILLAPYGFGAEDLYVFLAAIAAFFTVMAIGRTLIVRNTFQSRIKLLQERRAALRSGVATPRRRRRQYTETVHFMRRIVNRLQLLKKGQMGELNSRLVSAGIRSKDAIYIYTFAKLVLPFVLGIAALCYVFFAMADNPAMWKWGVPVFGIYLGIRLPEFFLDHRRHKRYVLIQRALADTLDLLMICAEAGLSLAQGLERVSRELRNAYPEMADELGLTSIEMSFQPDRQKSLNGLAQRVQLPEVKGIVNVLIQTEKYGTPIAQALRTLAQEFRTQRMLRAEQKAARLPAIMTVPMIIFILPTLFIVVIAPAAIDLLDTM
jgi:tight adherence protein C